MQIGALIFLGVVYVFRLIWLFKFKACRERTFAAGNEKAGIGFSLMNVAMPWAMESTRKKPSFYAQFVVFHIGIAATISATFIIPFWPSLFKIRIVIWVFEAGIGAAFLVGLMRLYRRLANPALRLISTLDDYFSLILVILFFAAGLLAVPSLYQKAEWPLILFFLLTTFLIVYVPFSKICHYLYYPFTRYFLGKTLGRRGVLPLKKANKEIN